MLHRAEATLKLLLRTSRVAAVRLTTKANDGPVRMIGNSIASTGGIYWVAYDVPLWRQTAAGKQYSWLALQLDYTIAFQPNGVSFRRPSTLPHGSD